MHRQVYKTGQAVVERTASQIVRIMLVDMLQTKTMGTLLEIIRRGQDSFVLDQYNTVKFNWSQYYNN